MTKTEKKLIYDLLKTADGYVNNYTRPQFAAEPVFEDDVIPEEKVEVAETPETSETIVEAAPATPVAPIAPESAPVSHGKTLSDINEKILRCTRCVLARTRNNVVPGQGVEHPDVLVIGEAPGYNEDQQGLPFVGKAGMLLDKMLAAIQLNRNTNCYIANIIKCRPPENRDPLPDEQDACFSFLEAQIHVLKPKMILCMGRISGHKMLDNDLPLKQIRGQIYDYNGIPLVVTYHPSALLQNEELKRPAWEDLKLFRKKLDEILANQ